MFLNPERDHPGRLHHTQMSVSACTTTKAIKPSTTAAQLFPSGKQESDQWIKDLD